MSRIPYVSEVSALSGRSNSPLQSANTDPNAYGANVGRATQELGQVIEKSANMAFEVDQREKERKRKEDAANKIATFDWTAQELAIRNEVGADSDEYQSRVREGYVTYVDEYVNSIEDDDTRADVRTRLISDLPNISSRSAQYEFSMKAEKSKEDGNKSIDALQNKIRLDPNNFDKYKTDGFAVLDALPNTTAAQREGMKLTYGYNAAKQRFDGMVESVKTIEDIDNIAAELAGTDMRVDESGPRDWSKEMLPADYESTLNALGSMRKSFFDKNNADARAVLGSLEERTKTNPTLLPTNELAEMQEVVKRTNDPAIVNRAARIMRSQEIIRQGQRLPPAELRAQINAANGNPGAAYPGVPMEVSNAINKATELYPNIPASYLGATSQREYGGEFSKAKKKAKDEVGKYKPSVAHKGVDLRNMRSDIVDAVTLAGQAYGAPMVLTASSGGVTTSDVGVNIVTVGMSGEDKARVASSLIDAGFTGISEFDGYLQADMTHVVPKSFGEVDGRVWGGASYLSPEVSAVLKERGYKAGADAASISRNQIVPPEPKFDFGKETGILGADGKPTSSAVGVYQFTRGTWLQTVQDPTVAAALGLDLTTATEEQLLALRADPNASAIAAAAFASKNQKTLMNTLGRSVNDAELYMAHFMGPGVGGATTFLTAHKNNPEQSAAALMPASAKANPNVFYKGGVVKDENAYTVAQVYDNIAADFSLAPSKVQYEDNEVRKAMLANAEKMLAADPMQHAIQTGSHAVTPLGDPGGFASRGSQARSVADYYGLPMKDFKPFSQDEEAFLKKTISEGTVEDNLALMGNIQSMGKEPAAAALKQLGEKDGTFAHAADLFMQDGAAVAGDIIRGRKRLVENPVIEEQIGTTRTTINDEFVSSTGGAMFDIEPARRQVIQEAATALYVERMATSGGNISKFNANLFEESVQLVMGGTKNSPALADVNGSVAVIPRGITAPELESAIERMSVEDWSRMSEKGELPRYADGTVIDPTDIRDEVTLRSIGGGQYKVMLDDGSLLTTGRRTPEGRLEAFIFVPDVEHMKRVSVRPIEVNYRGNNSKGQIR